MSIMNRMSRVITFRMPSAPGWKVQFNMNDQHFTIMRFSEVKNRWQLEPEADWRGVRRALTLTEIEKEAERVLQLEILGWQHDLATDGADPDFTDLFPSY
jgi:hypothetical protein